MPTERVGALVLAYRQEEYLAYYLAAVAPAVEVICVLYSEVPWTAYNPAARATFGGRDGTWAILREAQARHDNLHVIAGTWEVQEDMRNEGVEYLESLGMNWVLVADADEFYPDGVLERMLAWAAHYRDQIGGDVLWAGRLNHFRRFDYVIDPEYEGRDAIEVLFRTGYGTRFTDRRIVGAMRRDLPDEFWFHHFGYVLPEARMWEKIHTWGHAPDVLPEWFEQTWRGWTPASRDLCKRVRGRWKRAVPYDIAALPVVLHHHPFYLSCKGTGQ